MAGERETAVAEASVALTLAMARCGMNAASAWADEMGRFFGHRIAADMEFVRTLSDTAAPVDAMAATAAFVDCATADYAAFARRTRQVALAAPSQGLRSAEDGFCVPGPLPIE